MIHFYKRIRTHLAAAFILPGVGLATAVNETAPSLEQVRPDTMILYFGGFIVVVLGAMALAWVRWLGKVESNVPRDPDRIAEALAEIKAEVRGLREEVQRIDRNVAHIEGRMMNGTEMVVVR